MLVAWLSSVSGEHTVVEEFGVSVDDDARVRRADVAVLVEGRTHALEIEYKAFAIQAWQRKQADFESVNIPCTWLLGHSRVRPVEPKLPAGALGAVRVTVPKLVRAWSEYGLDPIAINPRTRQVGVLTDDEEGYEPLNASGQAAWLHIFSIDECTFDVRYGMATPLSVALARARAEPEARSRRAEEARERELKEQAKRESEAAKIRALHEANRSAHDAAWDASPARVKTQQRWERVPTVLTHVSSASRAIDALSIHWRSTIYFDCVWGRAPLTRIDLAECVNALRAHDIRPTLDSASAIKAIEQFLAALARVGCLQWMGAVRRDSGYYVVVRPVLNGAPLVGTQREPKPTNSVPAPQHALPRTNGPVDVTQPPAFEPLRDAWLRSVWFRAIELTYGHVPACVDWDDVTDADAVPGPRQIWHAALVIQFVSGRSGETFAIEEAFLAVETAANVTLSERGQHKVEVYLGNLAQRGYLLNPLATAKIGSLARFEVLRDIAQRH